MHRPSRATGFVETKLFSLIAACISLSLFFLAALASPVTARAQVTFTGDSANQNFGTVAIGSVSAARTLRFSVPAGTTVGSIAVVTTGIADLDFTSATAGTCTAKVYSSIMNCTVAVQFAPSGAGLRKGAVVFYSGPNKGTVLASVPLYGIGTGPQIAFGPGVVSPFVPIGPGMELENPTGVALNAAGDLFILDSDSDPNRYRLVKAPANGGDATTINATVNGAGLYLPSCVAVDGAGDLFIGEFYGRVVEVPTGGGPAIAITPAVNGVAMNFPSGLAVGRAGDLYIADFMNNRVLEVPAGGGAAIAIGPTVNGVPLNDPHGLAVDDAGNLYIADLGNNRVVMVPAGGGAATAIEPIVNGVGLQNPEGLAADGAGDLFIADNVNHRVVEVPAGGGAAIAIDPIWYDGGLGEVSGVAVNSSGDLFIIEGGTEGSHSIVEKVLRSQPPVFNFPLLTNVGATDAIDGTHTVQAVNVGNASLKLTALMYPTDFPEVGGDSAACTGTTTLSAGQECDLSFEFAPVDHGALSESVTLTDNALNVTGAQQLIVLTGTGEYQAAITSPAPGSALPGPNVTFTWSAATGAVSWYFLSLGSTGPGSKNIFNTGDRTVTSWTATGVPTNGETIYARLTTNFNGVSLYSDYIYAAATQSALVSPAPGAVLPGPTVMLNWTASTGATGYTVWLGSTGVGSNNISDRRETTTSDSFAGLPTNGETIYARLYTNFNETEAHADYTYTAATEAVLSSPTPGALLSGPTVKFTSTTAPGETGSRLVLGSTGAGSSNLYDSGEMKVASATATGLPTNGETLYARLYTYFNGVQVYADFTYTAAQQATLISPAAGPLLQGPVILFTWTKGNGATNYAILVGTTGPGSSNLINSGQSKVRFAMIGRLPAKGETIYARLSTNFDGVEAYTDYIFEAR